MPRVLVVTDSSACLPPRARARAHVRVLPITILLADGEWPDGPETAARVYAAVAAGERVSSSPPTAVDYLKAIEDGDFDAAVVVTPAVEFTVMYRNASVAARLSSRPVEVVDCRTAAAAQSLVVLAVLEAVGKGASVQEAAAVARQTAARAELVAALPTMNAVEHNAALPPSAVGRVGAGSPSLFRFHSGTVTHVGDVPHGVDPVEALHAVWAEGGGTARTPTLVFHAAEDALGRRLAASLPTRARVVPFSPAMAVHTGPGWLGVAWLSGAAQDDGAARD